MSGTAPGGLYFMTDKPSTEAEQLVSDCISSKPCLCGKHPTYVQTSAIGAPMYVCHDCVPLLGKREAMAMLDYLWKNRK